MTSHSSSATAIRRGPIAFSGATIDRADHLRASAEAMSELAAGGVLLRLDGLEPELAPEPAGGANGWDAALSFGTPAEVGAGAELVFLGLLGDGRGCFVAAPDAASGSIAPPGPKMWSILANMAPEEVGLYGIARSIAGWHARHRFCARCGGPTILARGGWQRDCQNDACRAQHFPRTDPVVIMTVEHDGDLLLGRQPRFPAGRYSALAGFLEPGETIEETVAREVWEEAGVRVEQVRYVASQPWPFPSSLMLGCHAFAQSRELTIDTTELEEARWFTRAEVAQAMHASARGEAGEAFIAPPPHALAWHLLNIWLDRG